MSSSGPLYADTARTHDRIRKIERRREIRIFFITAASPLRVFPSYGE